MRRRVWLVKSDRQAHYNNRTFPTCAQKYAKHLRTKMTKMRASLP